MDGKDFIAGWIGGCAGLVIGHPFDTMKVRLQTSHYKGLWDCINKTYRYEQMHGFYRGMTFPFLSVGVINSLLFGVYGNTIKFLHTLQNKDCKVVPNLWEVYAAGFISGVVQVFPSCPIEVVKIKLQSQAAGISSTYYKGSIDCFLSLCRHRGIRSLYKGFGVMLIRDLPSNGVYFFVYELILRTFQKMFLNEPISIIIAGGAAGACSWFIILPFDVVKSRMQAEAGQVAIYSNMVHCFKESYKEGGWRTFYRGGNSCILRSLPVNGITFLFYSYSLNALQKL